MGEYLGLSGGVELTIYGHPPFCVPAFLSFDCHILTILGSNPTLPLVSTQNLDPEASSLEEFGSTVKHSQILAADQRNRYLWEQ